MSTDPPQQISPDRAATQLPFAGIRVIEFTHMVMGPACGVILADLGPEVIKIEPLAAPMPSRVSAWAVYDVFTVKDDEHTFLAVVCDSQ